MRYGHSFHFLGVGSNVNSEESQLLVNCKEHDFRIATYANVQDFMNELLHRVFSIRIGPDAGKIKKKF